MIVIEKIETQKNTRILSVGCPKLIIEDWMKNNIKKKQRNNENIKHNNSKHFANRINKL
jgi:hypothetical protein